MVNKNMKKVVCIVLLVFVSSYLSKAQESKGEVVFDIVEEVPSFPGGQNEFINYLKKNIKYPPKSQA